MQGRTTQIAHSRLQVAQYAGRMAVELRNMCRQVQLHDLAYLFEIAAGEAAQVRPINGSELELGGFSALRAEPRNDAAYDSNFEFTD